MNYVADSLVDTGRCWESSNMISACWSSANTSLANKLLNWQVLRIKQDQRAGRGVVGEEPPLPKYNYDDDDDDEDHWDDTDDDNGDDNADWL